jgi:hypothetical protein
MEKKWSRTEKWGGLILTVVGTIAAVFVVPEFRQFFRLDKPQTVETAPTQTAAAPSTPVQTEPSKSEPLKPESSKTKKTHKPNNNVTGNNNQTTAIAPNGIAISGGNVTNPTVNNFGPPPLQLSWSVSDLPSQEASSFAKTVTVKSNVYYAPVNVAIFCDTEVDGVSPTGASMGVVIGNINNDKKSWWVRLSSPPITPDSPLTVLVKSSRPFNVVSVRKVATKQP